MREHAESDMTIDNAYSRLWFNTFLGTIDPPIVAPEVAFLVRQLPRDQFRTILDLCCGPGRHAAPLAQAGYVVLGIDRDGDALAAARARSSETASFVRGDMRTLPIRDESVDAIICMWQSFGYFDDATNRAVLADVAHTLRPDGRLVLDVYHREHYARAAGERQVDRDGLRVVEQRWMEGNRLHVAIRYDDGGERAAGFDTFDWRVYSPEELIDVAQAAGFTPRLVCCGLDETRAPSADVARMQLVFTRH